MARTSSVFTALCITLFAQETCAQDIVIFNGRPTANEILQEVGVRPKTRSLGGTPRALLNGPGGARFDVPATDIPTQRPTTVARAEDQTPPSLLGDKWIAAMVNFAKNKDEVRGSEHAVLDSIAEALLQEPSLNVLISGHADKSGGDVINIPLSKRRAAAVRRYFKESYGISSERMRTRGVGSDEPLPGMGVYDPRNRRVQFGFLR